MRIGWAKQDITPQLPTYMAGYMDRKEQAKGVNDPIFARTIVIEDITGERMAIISTDLLCVTKAQTDTIRVKANELTGIEVDHIIICATHTHSGPLTFDYPLFGKTNEAYVKWLLEIIPSLVLQASKNLKDCKLGWYQIKDPSIGKNRRNYKKSETYLTLLSFVDLNNKLLATLFNYNCHPTILSAENLMISAEFPGAAVEALEEAYGKDVLFMFINGACGDISTRFTRKSQTYDEKNRIGRILAAQVIKGIEKTKYQKHNYITLIEKSFNLKEKEIPDEKQLERRIIGYRKKLHELKDNNSHDREIRIAETALHGSRVLKMLKKYKKNIEYEGIITAIKLGKGCIVTEPAELFSKLGKQIMKQSPFTTTMVIGYANGSIGYLPDKISYEEGGYEALSCCFECGSGEALVKIVVDTINELGK